MNNYFIIGKVNEGKSFLFNLFSKDHKTISNPKANTTIDIIKKTITEDNAIYQIFDTPGFNNFNQFIEMYEKIIALKLKKLHFIYLAKNITAEDNRICKFLFSNNFPLYFYSFKKTDDEQLISNLYTKIFNEEYENFNYLRKSLSNENKFSENQSPIEKKRIAIFGKENTGKSTLFNKITSVNLSKTSPELHTTRDSVNWDINYNGQVLEFIDTAGFIRSRSKRKNFEFEKLSLDQSEFFIKNASLIILLLDAKSETRLDLSLIGSLSKRNKPFLVLVNKMDLIEDKSTYQKKFLDYLSSNHSYFNSLNIFFISALDLTRPKLLKIIDNQLHNKFNFKTSYLNKILRPINVELGKIQKSSREFKIYFISAFTVNQKNYFKISCNFNRKNIKPHIKTFLSKILIRELGLKGVNFNLIF